MVCRSTVVRSPRDQHPRALRVQKQELPGILKAAQHPFCAWCWSRQVHWYSLRGGDCVGRESWEVKFIQSCQSNWLPPKRQAVGVLLCCLSDTQCIPSLSTLAIPSHGHMCAPRSVVYESQFCACLLNSAFSELTEEAWNWPWWEQSHDRKWAGSLYNELVIAFGLQTLWFQTLALLFTTCVFGGKSLN